MAICASTYADSAAKSREAVPSSELSVADSNPSSSAIASGSRCSEEPASAPEPYGETARRLSASWMRSRSRSSDWACARRECASRIGCAAWKWVLPGMIASGWASACWTIASIRSETSWATPRSASRSHMRNIAATWSLRDRPARRRPPTSGPTRSIRPRSIAPCTSSSVGSGPNEPSATSRPSLSRPSSITVRSSSLSKPALLSTFACALEASTS